MMLHVYLNNVCLLNEATYWNLNALIEQYVDYFPFFGKLFFY